MPVEIGQILRSSDGNGRSAHGSGSIPGYLPRTARTLISHASVDKDRAERALGHVIGGVRGVYDRHEFVAEKRRPLEGLAALIERIRPSPKNAA